MLVSLHLALVLVLCCCWPLTPSQMLVSLPRSATLVSLPLSLQLFLPIVSAPVSATVAAAVFADAVAAAAATAVACC
jgi:hypothetical protein